MDNDTDPPRDDAPTGGGVGEDPLRPSEFDTYRTDHAAGGDPREVRTPPLVIDTRTWILAGIGLLVLFVVGLAWAVFQGLS